MMQISTDQCGNDYCGDFGSCQISNQIYVFSACKCTSGMFKALSSQVYPDNILI